MANHPSERDAKDPLLAGMEAAFVHKPGARSDFRAESILAVLSTRSVAVPRIHLQPEADEPAPTKLQPLTDSLRSHAPAADKYQVQGEIARGGMGTVLKGHDTDLGRDVAMKLLHDKYLDNADVLERFVEEAQIGGQLQHPGIVPVYDLGLVDDKPFFTMKLIKGRTLASLLADGDSQDRRRLLSAFEQVCQTVAYAHSRGVIHRDLKPANVMVGAFGEVQVVDWGMGKVLAHGGIADEARSQNSHTSVVETTRSRKVGTNSMAGSVMGTPAYMPPEQANGHVDFMDERSDVFALGGRALRDPHRGPSLSWLGGRKPSRPRPGRSWNRARLGSTAAGQIQSWSSWRTTV